MKAKADKTELADPAAFDERSARDKEVISEAQHVGSSPEVMNKTGHSGMLHQTVSPAAIKADESGAAGGDSDISGGVAGLDQTAGRVVDQNEYNR